MKFIFLDHEYGVGVSNMHTTSWTREETKMADIVATGAGGNVLDMTFCQESKDMVAVMDSPDYILSDWSEGRGAGVSGAYSTCRYFE